MMPITASIQAMFTAAPAMPLKPKMAAMIAMTRKTMAQLSMMISLSKLSGDGAPVRSRSRRVDAGWACFFPPGHGREPVLRKYSGKACAIIDLDSLQPLSEACRKLTMQYMLHQCKRWKRRLAKESRIGGRSKTEARWSQ